MVRVIRMVAAATDGRPQNQAGNDEHPEIPQRVFRERNPASIGGDQPHQIAG